MIVIKLSLINDGGEDNGFVNLQSTQESRVRDICIAGKCGPREISLVQQTSVLRRSSWLLERFSMPTFHVGTLNTLTDNHMAVVTKNM